MPAPHRPRRLTAFLVAMALLIVTPLAVVAADRFDDVPESNIFHDDITWLADAAVTLGCNPPDNDEFCPEDNVTRQQMAAFMKRLAENQVVDAGWLQGNTADDFVQQEEPDSISAAMTTQESGVAQMTEADGLAVPSDLTTVTSVVLEAPADGWAIVTMSTDVQILHTTATASLTEIGVSMTADTLAADEDQDVQIPGSAASGLYIVPTSATKAFPVTAGSNTFYVVADQTGGTGTLFDTHVSALYVSTNYGGVDLAGSAEDDTSEGQD